MADGDGLLTHPLGRGAGGRQVADVVAQAAGLDAGGGRHQDPAVVHAGAHVQHRRDTYGLADLGQAGAAELVGRFRRQQADFTAAMAEQPVVRTMTSFFSNSLIRVRWELSWVVRQLLQPTTPATPRTRPSMMLSFRV